MLRTLRTSWGGTKRGGWKNVIYGNILVSYFVNKFCVVFVHLRFYPTASVGSRNALHVVGVTPVLHVVRSCTTVRAVFHYLVVWVGIIVVDSCNGYYVVLLWFLLCVFVIPR